MADDLQKQHAANMSAEKHMMNAWNLTRNQARNRLHEFRTQQAAQTPRQQAQPADESKPVPPPPKIDTETQQFAPKSFTLGTPPGPMANEQAGTVDATITDFVYLDTSDSALKTVGIYNDNNVQPV